MPVPSVETIINNLLSEDSLDKECDYFPCHPGIETCNLCFCLFYPCGDTEHGFFKKTAKGNTVWSCINCDWIHKKRVVHAIKRFISDKENRKLKSDELYNAFIQHKWGGTVDST